MVGEDEHRGVKRRVVSPPALPLMALPGAAVRTELVPSHDLRADAWAPVAGKGVIDARGTAGLAVHGVEGAGGEEPLMQPVTGVTERSIEALPFTGAKPIQRDREVVHAHQRHRHPPSTTRPPGRAGWLPIRRPHRRRPCAAPEIIGERATGTVTAVPAAERPSLAL